MIGRPFCVPFHFVSYNAAFRADRVRLLLSKIKNRTPLRAEYFCLNSFKTACLFHTYNEILPSSQQFFFFTFKNLFSRFPKIHDVFPQTPGVLAMYLDCKSSFPLHTTRQKSHVLEDKSKRTQISFRQKILVQTTFFTM